MGWVGPGKCPTDPCFGGSICGVCETTVGRIRSGKRVVFFTVPFCYNVKLFCNGSPVCEVTFQNILFYGVQVSSSVL